MTRRPPIDVAAFYRARAIECATPQPRDQFQAGRTPAEIGQIERQHAADRTLSSDLRSGVHAQHIRSANASLQHAERCHAEALRAGHQTSARSAIAALPRQDRPVADRVAHETISADDRRRADSAHAARCQARRDRAWATERAAQARQIAIVRIPAGQRYLVAARAAAGETLEQIAIAIQDALIAGATPAQALECGAAKAHDILCAHGQAGCRTPKGGKAQLRRSGGIGSPWLPGQRDAWERDDGLVGSARTGRAGVAQGSASKRAHATAQDRAVRACDAADRTIDRLTRRHVAETQARLIMADLGPSVSRAEKRAARKLARSRAFGAE